MGPIEPVTGQRSRPGAMTALALLLAVWVVPMGLSGTAVALTPISHDLGTDHNALQWIVNGFNVAFAVFTLVWGSLSDRVGHRTTLRMGITLYLLAALTSALADTLVLAAVARTLAGAAGAAVFTGAAAVISNNYPDQDRARIFTLYGATIGFGLAAGPGIAGGLIAVWDWRAVYMVHAALLAVALLASLAVPADRRNPGASRRLIEVSLLRNTRFVAMCLVAVAGSIAFVTMLTYLPTALSATTGLDAGAIGTRMFWLTVPVLVAPFAGERLARHVRRSNPTTVIVLGLALMLAGLAGMPLLTPGNAATAVAAPAFLIGTGFGLTLGLVDAEALSTVPASSSGTAAGVLNFFRMGSEAVYVALYGALVARSVNTRLGDRAQADPVIAGQHTHPAVYEHAFTTTVWVLLASLAVTSAAALALLLTRRDAHPRTPAVRQAREDAAGRLADGARR